MKSLALKTLVLLCLPFIPLTSFAADWPDSVFSELNYGLYWFGYGDNWEKAIPGQSNAYYNPDNKTLIYIHGWQPGTVTTKARESFNSSAGGGPDLDLAAAWLSAGYNVGVLYWNQFADESEVKDAEAKIWASHGPQGMRWLKLNGTYESFATENNVTELLYNNLVDNLNDFNADELRIAGHSLGNQLAISISDRLRSAVIAGNISPDLLPDRIALLDPFYSNGAKDFLSNDWTGERARWASERLISAGVAIEAYRSSSVTSTIFVGDANDSLMNQTAFIQLKPWYFNAWEQDKKHVAAVWHYLWSFMFNEPTIKDSDDLAASASTSTNRIKQLMASSYALEHDLGAYTKSPSDDRFKYVNK